MTQLLLLEPMAWILIQHSAYCSSRASQSCGVSDTRIDLIIHNTGEKTHREHDVHRRAVQKPFCPRVLETAQRAWARPDVVETSILNNNSNKSGRGPSKGVISY